MPTTPVQRVSAGFERAKGRWRSWLLGTVLAVASGGCSPPNEPLRGRLHVLVASTNDEGLNSSDQDILKNFRFLTEEFNKLHPRVALTQGPLEVCPSSPGGLSAGAVCWSGLAAHRWPRHSRTLLLQPI